MKQTIFVLRSENNQYVADRISRATGAVIIDIQDNMMGPRHLSNMCNLSKTDHFYIIKTDYELIFDHFDFTFVPDPWDNMYIHIWNEPSVRLVNKNYALEHVEKFTDHTLYQGQAELKIYNETISKPPMFDIVFISYDEYDAEHNYYILKERYPRAKRVHGVKGIYAAHRQAAILADESGSDMFYAVDADAEVLDEFRFDYNPHSLDRLSVHVWKSINPVNHLQYGYGGIKLFPTKSVIEYNGSPIDFSTSVGKGFKSMDAVSNITKFDTDPFSAWRSGFRECTKLAANIIRNGNNQETEYRLDVWCTVGSDTMYGDFVLQGANQGREFGKKNASNPEVLALINDYDWLSKQFDQQ